MKTKMPGLLGALTAIALLFQTCKKDPANTADDKLSSQNEMSSKSASVKIFATGLNNPRGLKFGPDGYLYVAEGGTGGTDSTVGQCTQVVAPIGPYTGSPTGGRISKISSEGERTTLTDKLPSSQTSALVGSLTSGVADVGFIGNTLYALLAGAGCSHGVTSLPNGIVRVNKDGSYKLVADLSAFVMAHPVKNIEEDDFEPDETPYSMVNVGSCLFVIQPNHGVLDRYSTNGQIKRIIEISATQGHIVPASITYHKGNFYVGNLNTYPIIQGSSKIYKINANGNLDIYASGFTTVLGVAFDKEGRLYVLENTSVSSPLPLPGTGRIIRVNKDGDRETIASNLNLPTALTFGPDGKLYVSNVGFGPEAIGGGEVLQIEIMD
jgi:hypothetical protein